MGYRDSDYSQRGLQRGYEESLLQMLADHLHTELGVRAEEVFIGLVEIRRRTGRLETASRHRRVRSIDAMDA
jgi:hypothetical protein